MLDRRVLRDEARRASTVAAVSPAYRERPGAATGWPDGPATRAVPSRRYGLPMNGRIKDMDRWLGNGGMELIGTVGGSLDGYGVDGEGLGWVSGTFAPTTAACNPHGIVQAGVHALLLDAAMNFAINAALPGKSRTRGTLEMKIETMRPALDGGSYQLRGDVVRMARQVAYAEAGVTDADGQLVSRSTGTFLLHRPEGAPPTG